jgi:L-threonate 2-dehydrogenase
LMGLGLALRLRDGQWPVVVRDIDAQRERLAVQAGAHVAPDAAALAARCALLIVVVVDAAQAEAVLFGTAGAAQAMAPGGCVVLCPTIAPADTERLATRLGALGLGCIDAPMSGGPLRARDGSMSLMVACEDALFERHQALLQWLSSRLFRVGTRCGDGARTKLVNNLLAAANLATACEAMLLAERVGLDPQVTLNVIAQSSGQSWIGSDRMARALAGDRQVHAQLSLLTKDSKLAIAMAMASDADSGNGNGNAWCPELGARAAALFQAASADGCAADDDSQLLNWLKRRAQKAVG